MKTKIAICLALLITCAASPAPEKIYHVLLPVIVHSATIAPPIQTQQAISATLTAMPTPAPSATRGGPLMATPTPVQ